AGHLPSFEARFVQSVKFLTARLHRAGDDTPGEDDIGFERAETLFRIAHHRILTAARRPHDGDKHTLPYRKGRLVLSALDRGGNDHATRRPSRQTVRTTGMPSSSRTRTRSARRPGSITPRSLRPTASAGFLETFATASGSVMPSTASLRKNAAWTRL